MFQAAAGNEESGKVVIAILLNARLEGVTAYVNDSVCLDDRDAQWNCQLLAVEVAQFECNLEQKASEYYGIKLLCARCFYNETDFWNVENKTTLHGLGLGNQERD